MVPQPGLLKLTFQLKQPWLLPHLAHFFCHHIGQSFADSSNKRRPFHAIFGVDRMQPLSNVPADTVSEHRSNRSRRPKCWANATHVAMNPDFVIDWPLFVSSIDNTLRREVSNVYDNAVTNWKRLFIELIRFQIQIRAKMMANIFFSTNH